MRGTNGGNLTLANANTDAPGDGRRQSPVPGMDDLNKSIIRYLQQDGRTPFKEIADRLGVSEGTIRNRVGAMKQSGILKIVAMTDPSAFEYQPSAMLGVTVSSGATPAAVADRLMEFEEIVYITWVSGRYDLLIEVVTKTNAEMAAFIDERLHRHSDVAGIEVMTCLSMYKNQFLLKRDVE